MFTHSPGVFTEGSSSPESFFLPPSVDKHSPAALSASPRLWRSPQASCPPGLPLRPPQAPHRPRLFYFPWAFFMTVCFGQTPCSCPAAAKFLPRPKAFLSHPSQRCVSVCPDPSAFTLSPHPLGPSFETPQSPFLAPNSAVGSLGHQNGPVVAKPLGGCGAGASQGVTARCWDSALGESENSPNGA